MAEEERFYDARDWVSEVEVLGKKVRDVEKTSKR